MSARAEATECLIERVPGGCVMYRVHVSCACVMCMCDVHVSAKQLYTRTSIPCSPDHWNSAVKGPHAVYSRDGRLWPHVEAFISGIYIESAHVGVREQGPNAHQAVCECLSFCRLT